MNSHDPLQFNYLLWLWDQIHVQFVEPKILTADEQEQYNRNQKIIDELKKKVGV